MTTSDSPAPRPFSIELVALAPPLVIEGLRQLGCRIVASSGCTRQLPALLARTGAQAAVIFSDGFDGDALLAPVTAACAMRASLRLVVLLPCDAHHGLSERLRALGAEVGEHGIEAPALRALLGLQPLAAGHLTQREIDVLALAAEGLTNQAIARRLGLQPDTVKNYLRSVHRKIGARSRTEAVMLAARSGYCVLPVYEPAVRLTA